MDGKKKVSIALSPETLEIIDKSIEEKVFANRSHAVERCVYWWHKVRNDHLTDLLTGLERVLQLQKKGQWPRAPTIKDLMEDEELLFDAEWLLELGYDAKSPKDVVRKLIAEAKAELMEKAEN
jgi:Arc/MetJ-type ribon-helix-helix transcriptional regulator